MCNFKALKTSKRHQGQQRLKINAVPISNLEGIFLYKKLSKRYNSNNLEVN
ncbi:hypothetical protein [Prochlorococcus sp. ALOHA_ZT_50]|jgi:hypothetical protein|uniref:hypothetical protein n=1 Tax=Prochlorococcus sp. ALOHA_ZT_50 TaxID=2919303 RepID=UPI00257CC733|nr:hypothetical protein [Prochlorococcus sp. ALOHA_ZT_50]